jgi:carboxynorspermidine decarboxylase
VATEMYNPCAANSRLGIPRAQFEGQDLSGIDGLHFHAMCEQGADVLERILKVFEAQYGDLIPGRRWINFGGGHHITRPGYDVHLLVRLVRDFRRRYGTEVILEPGEAAALNAGVLIATVLDIVENGMKIAILDTSAADHMPDTLEMPYRPGIVGTGLPGELPHTYRLGGLTCLAGDVIGDYSFAEPLAVGSKIVLTDMLHYTMVKNTTFNGVKLPAIATYDGDSGSLRVLRTFGYEDYKTRLS